MYFHGLPTGKIWWLSHQLYFLKKFCLWTDRMIQVYPTLFCKHLLLGILWLPLPTPLLGMLWLPLSILQFILVVRNLQHLLIQTDGFKPMVCRYTFIAMILFFHFVGHLFDLRAANAFPSSWHYLAITTCTPVSKQNNEYSIVLWQSPTLLFQSNYNSYFVLSCNTIR